MSEAGSSPKMSIKDRIAALQNQGGEAPPPLTKPTAPKAKSGALAGRIAALQKNAEPTAAAGGGAGGGRKPEIGKLKPPAGAVPIVPFGAGPPPSLAKKQRERDERMARLRDEAANASAETTGEKPRVGRLKAPLGAVPVVPFGAGPPPSLLKRQKEREEASKKSQHETNQSTSEPGSKPDAEVNAEDALLSRPTIKGKRRPRTRTER